MKLSHQIKSSREVTGLAALSAIGSKFLFNQKFTWDNMRTVVYDGDQISVAGFISYNSSLNTFQIENPISIIGGGIDNMKLIFNSLSYKA